ncbi:NAD(P)H oxidoreductase [Salmonella enterica subsp. enterica serovar Panama]|uniref:NAD(P)H oxidoreductase n=1 Tax=Enterobacteriaceae TaxID=543 RepID=UPI001473BEBE|nr:NAD(P)H oxidoreductase [Salmonella enterica]EGO0259878.1 NAD(P)H oxidoreductase [Salmonella enterica subsp. enterica serovar Panama]EGP7450108.1 NAD(P)H oxidoreductase [Salmonella enterica subsp. enterica serovar Panama]NMF70673.1 NAD(P)H oxidoreductase [Salmonella enterica subsp. enterica serovar Panama]NMF75397.1 NAD(P)H oxidoreductase [Salmonella enterica subsp. enterica serovar Panama]NMF80122.1 NAD(P)H oxidoreductase [Salmonella enterica subsp. enterica serovar Panama]
MKTENMYIVWAHPRSDSLTAQVVDAIRSRSMRAGINVTTLDLYRNGFNPVLDTEDEPEWGNPGKTHSDEVQYFFGELMSNDTLVVVYPVWWYSFPAILKGYLDRVFNYGLAYGGGHTLPVKKIRWVALVGGTKESYIEHGWNNAMNNILTSMAHYVGVEDSNALLLYNTLNKNDDDSVYQKLMFNVNVLVDELS